MYRYVITNLLTPHQLNQSSQAMCATVEYTNIHIPTFKATINLSIIIIQADYKIKLDHYITLDLVYQNTENLYNINKFHELTIQCTLYNQNDLNMVI